MRTLYCGDLRAEHLGQHHLVCGWVHRRRDHGGVIFIDLRDRQGLLQVVFHPDQAKLFALAETLRNEFVIKVRGIVIRRPEGTVNANLPSGMVELNAEELEILNPAITPPFSLDEDHLSEMVRLTHRVMDLRRPVMQHNLLLRFRLTVAIRQFLNWHGFLDIETPMLTRSTPEGARDYLVPSRVHAGQFFALPQSPQLFKQLLMVAGFDRYYQITRCFRDEDLRADRQPEFTQVDIETSFMTAADITGLMEEMICAVFKEVLAVELPQPFPRLSYAEAMENYGSDKPDLRIPLKLVDITDLMKDEEFQVMRNAATMEGGKVMTLKVPGGESLTRGDITQLTELVSTYGAQGLAYIKVPSLDNPQSPILKFLSAGCIKALLERTQAAAGDILFFGAGAAQVVWDSLGALRLHLGHQRKLLTGASWAPLWVVDFPMFEWNPEGKRWQARHHPFTAPQPGHEAYLQSAPDRCLAQAYDMVLNGWEIGGGSVRIHQEPVQSQVFTALGISDEEARNKFGFLLDALRYGAPPHGGIAFGLDRVAAMMAGAESIRDVIAFPKTQRAQCLLTQAPSSVDERQLKELHLRLRS